MAVQSYGNQLNRLCYNLSYDGKQRMPKSMSFQSMGGNDRPFHHCHEGLI